LEYRCGECELQTQEKAVVAPVQLLTQAPTIGLSGTATAADAVSSSEPLHYVTDLSCYQIFTGKRRRIRNAVRKKTRDFSHC
jgi:hypothetical protein